MSELNASLLKAYDPAFAATMDCKAKDLLVPESCLERAGHLETESRDLLDTLLLAAPLEQPVSQRFRIAIEALGEPLWRSGLLLPRATPSRGATLDPRNYAASCRLNPGLASRKPFCEQDLTPDLDPQASLPPFDSHWDAMVVAAELERHPLGLTQEGRPRHDGLEKLWNRLGGRSERWTIALALGRTQGLVRPVQGKLTGFPESTPRPLRDPSLLLSDEESAAGRALLVLVGQDWVDWPALLSLLEKRSRTLLFSPNHALPPQYASRPSLPFQSGWQSMEVRRFEAACTCFFQVRVFDVARGPDGVLAVRRSQGDNERAGGLLLTPDLEILVAPCEIDRTSYGRLCRLAPYQDGDRVHRHRLDRPGVAADLAAGHTNPEDFLASHSRIGVPEGVAQFLAEWSRSASRLSLFTGVDILEEDASFRIVQQHPPGVRVLDYGGSEPPPAELEVEGDLLRVPLGKDPLQLRFLVEAAGEYQGVEDGAHVYTLRPLPHKDPQRLIEALSHYCESSLPGNVEAAILSVSEEPYQVQDALLLKVSPEAAAALSRDPSLAETIQGPLESGLLVLKASDLDLVEARLAALGFRQEKG